jgi:hypothetical protein
MGKHEWHPDKNGNWVNEQGGRPKNAKQIKELNRRNQINRTNVQPSTPTTTSPTTTTPTTTSSPAVSKIGKFSKLKTGLGTVGKFVGKGAAPAAIIGTVGGFATDAAIANGAIEAGSTTHKLAAATSDALA